MRSCHRDRVLSWLPLLLWCCSQPADGPTAVNIVDGSRDASVNPPNAGKSGSAFSPGNFQSPTGVLKADAGDPTGAPLVSACVGDIQRGHEVEV
jgi:hypothetical protein